jgi:hypothetical protein
MEKFVKIDQEGIIYFVPEGHSVLSVMNKGLKIGMSELINSADIVISGGVIIKNRFGITTEMIPK